MAISAGHSSSRRLVDSYIMFGLACMFLCVSAGALHVWRGSLTDLLGPAVVAALLVLLAGGYVLRRTLRFHAAIEDQLSRAAQSGAVDAVFTPIPDPQPAAMAWNAILAKLEDHRALTALEARLNGTLATVDHQRWSDLFNALSEGLAVCDSNSCIVQANNSLAVLLGTESAEALLGKDPLDLIGGATSSVQAVEELAGLRSSTTFSRDVQLGADLSAGVLRVARTALGGEAFEAGSTLWTIRDVTQQRLAEEMRNQFVSTATHELRTPLTNIRAYAELLADEDDLDVEKQKCFCNIIHAEASRLSRFVDQMLNVSQMEAGALSLSRHETDIERLLGEVCDNVQPQAVKKHINFDTQLPPKLPKLSVDKDKLAAALINLLGNAVKYTPKEGRVKLTVEVTGEQIHFHVDDTGIGISAEELPRISEKFFRSEDSRVRSITGSGLGLAFAQEVARLHGGAISISSELNKGSRFTLTMPLDK